MSRLNSRNSLWAFSSLVVACVVVSLLSYAAVAARPDKETDKINKAIDALGVAHDELAVADDDFHGHKRAAIEKTEAAKKVLEDSRDHHIDKAVEKIQAAIDELKAGVEGDAEGSHPKIHNALRALEEAKDQL